MKTLNLISVVESANLVNAVEVKYEDIQLSVVANATVEAADASSVVVGTPMSKYFGTEVRMHPVGRDSKGRFVSIKDTAEDIVDAAIENAADLLGFVFEDDSIDSPQPIQVTAPQEESKEEVKEMVVTAEVVTTEKGFEPCVLNFDAKPERPTTPRKLFGLAPAVFDFKETEQLPEHTVVTEPVYVHQEEVVQFDQSQFDDMDTALYEANNASYQDMYEYDYAPVQMEFEPQHFEQDVQVNSNQVHYSKLDLVREVANTLHVYFNKGGCSLKSLNKDQVRAQMGVVYKQRLQHLHTQAEETGKVIAFIIDKVVNAYGNRSYMYMNAFLPVLNKVLSDLVTKAKQQYAA